MMGDSNRDKHKSEHNPQRIFLPNISNFTTDNNLRSAFAHYGKIREARVFRKPDGSPAGKGIVWFENTETVNELLHKTYIVVDGAEVKVAPFYTKSKPEKSSSAAPLTGHSSRTFEKLTESSTSRKIDSSDKTIASTSARADQPEKCMICKSPVDCVLLWFGHNVVCSKCGGKLKNCPKPGCSDQVVKVASVPKVPKQ